MSRRGISLHEQIMFASFSTGVQGPAGPPGADGKVAGHIASAPPAGMYPVINVFWDPALSKMIGEYNDLGDPSATLTSTPPVGKFAITNIYFNPASGRMVSEYEDET